MAVVDHIAVPPEQRDWNGAPAQSWPQLGKTAGAVVELQLPAWFQITTRRCRRTRSPTSTPCRRTSAPNQ
jgi:hypothetical protein